MKLGRTRVSLALGIALLTGAFCPTGEARQQITFEDVIANLKASAPSNRIQALKMLRESGYLEAALPVAPLMADPAKDVQFDAIDTEVSLFLVDEAYTREVGRAIVGKGDASLALLAFAEGPGATVANPVPPSVITGLIGAMKSPFLEVRFEATYALGVLGPPLVRTGTFREAKAAVDRLLALMQDADPLMRLGATHVLARLMGTARTFPERNRELLDVRQTVGDQFVVGINDPDPLQRLACIKALGDVRHDRGLQALTEQLTYYKKGEIAQAALESIARIGHASSIELLTTQLESSDEQVRQTAVEGLARINDRIAIQTVEGRVGGDRSRKVKLALAFVRYRATGASQIGVMVEALKPNVFGSKALQAQAWNYLIELGPELVPSLLPFLQSKDVDTRGMIAEALGVIGDARALPSLDAALQDPSRTVSSAVARSIKRLRPRPAGAGRL
jgi:HEAT repeat protein